MGFFKKLFEKKECSVCGNEIGLLGNRKLEDGNLCKDCARKLSPWFSDRRNSTVEEIKAQLAYREENYNALQTFEPTLILGDYYKMYVEEVNGVPTRFFVTDSSDYMSENPDIISFKDVISCVTDISEDRNELKWKNNEGEMVSYIPPKFEYSYQFTIEMAIRNNPYFDSIDFKVHSSSIDIVVQERPTSRVGAILGNNSRRPIYDVDYQKYNKLCQQIEQVVEDGKRGAVAPAPVPEAASEEAPVSEAPVRPASCPACGAPAGAGKFCEFCGSPLA